MNRKTDIIIDNWLKTRVKENDILEITGLEDIPVIYTVKRNKFGLYLTYVKDFYRVLYNPYYIMWLLINGDLRWRVIE